ncbi:MAG: hypothetical protein M1828_001348 [Chrysothrix sp. TS-e1954]|nr:MAG: hypothetical protein M1828_001348 [Chrysothrix sp. TS-e1954]
MPKDKDVKITKDDKPSLDDMIDLCRNRASILYPAHPFDTIQIVTAKNPDDNRWRAAAVARKSTGHSVVLRQITAFYTLTINGKPASSETFEKLRHGARPVMVELLLHTLEEELWAFLADSEAAGQGGASSSQTPISLSEDLPAYKA